MATLPKGAIHPPYVEELPWIIKAINPLIRFFTLQKVSLGRAIRNDWANERSFKRVIGLPGDSVRMEESVAYVMESGSSFYLSEFETSGKGYDIEAASTPDGWEDSLPLSGYFDTVTLDNNEYFVMGDKRGSSNDSRYWGAISESDIRGRVIFIYWPPRSFGFPR